MNIEGPREGAVRQVVTLKVKNNPGNVHYSKPLVFVIQAIPSDSPASDEDNAEEILHGFFMYLPWEIRRALGKLLVSMHPRDPQDM